MKFLYSATTRGFYEEDLSQYATVPGDLVEVSADEHMALLTGQSDGKVIAPDANGRPALFDPPPPAEEQVIRSYEKAVQAFMDQTAKDHGYDSVATAVSYADEPAVKKFQDDGRAFREWRSLVWAYCYAQLDAYKAGTVEKPTIEQLISELPSLSINAA